MASLKQALEFAKKRQWEDALNEYEALYRESPTDELKENIAATSRNAGVGAMFYKDYGTSLSFFRRSYEMFNDQKELAKLEKNIGLCHSYLNNLRDGLEWTLKARASFKNLLGQCDKLTRQRDLFYEMAKLDNRLVIIYSKLEQLDDSLKHLEKAMVMFDELKKPVDLANAYQSKGIILCRQEKYPEALDSFDQARKIFESLPREVKAAELRANQAETLFKMQKLELATAEIDKAVTTVRKLEAPLYRPYYIASQIYRATGESQKALGFIRESIDILESMRGLVRVDEFRASFFSDKMKAYELWVELCYETNDINTMYDAISRSKSRILIEELASIENRVSETVLDANLLEAERQGREKVDQAINDYYENPAPELKAKLKQTEQQYQSIMLQVKNETRKVYEVKLPDIPTLGQLVSRLSDGELLLDYYFTADRGFVLYADKVNCQVMEIKVNRAQTFEMAENINALIDSCRRYNPSTAPYRTMHANLLAYSRSAAEKLGLFDLPSAKTLTIIPHSGLHKLPFPVLPLGDAFLSDTYTIRILPSITLLKQRADQNDDRFSSCLAVADTLDNLPYSRAEVAILPEVFKHTTILINDQAIEEDIKRLMPDQINLHFACHASFNPENPLFSHIVLRDREQAIKHLEVNEITRLDLRSVNLVVLSACESGQGHVIRGDEVTGLSRAFLYAGASGVIATLWKVDDRATAYWSESFYRAFKETSCPAAALRQSIVVTRQCFPSPHTWAAFYYTGVL